MPLPKKLQDAIDAAKELPDDIRELLTKGSFFENDGEFLRTAETRMKGKLSDAEKRVTDAARKAREEAIAELCKQLGITDVEQVEEVKTKLAAADGSITEAEKAKSEIKRLERELKKASEQNVELAGFKVAVIKDKALSPHMDKINPDAREEIRELLLAKLVIDEKAPEKVSAPGGIEVGPWIEEWLKAKPFYKAPDFKAGAGTGPAGEKKDDGKGKPPATANGQGAQPGNGQGAGQGIGNGVGTGAGNDGKPTNGVIFSQQELAKAISAAVAEASTPPAQNSAGP